MPDYTEQFDSIQEQLIRLQEYIEILQDAINYREENDISTRSVVQFVELIKYSTDKVSVDFDKISLLPFGYNFVPKS